MRRPCNRFIEALVFVGVRCTAAHGAFPPYDCDHPDVRLSVEGHAPVLLFKSGKEAIPEEEKPDVRSHTRPAPTSMRLLDARRTRSLRLALAIDRVIPLH